VTDAELGIEAELPIGTVRQSLDWSYSHLQVVRLAVNLGTIPFCSPR
jgi:hypothetical protein